MEKPGNKENSEGYFIDDVFYGKKSSTMVEFLASRVNVALSMILSEKERMDRGLKVLDVGCGNGTYSKMILDMGNEVYGIDVRSERIRSAEQKGIKAIVGDLTKGIPFSDGIFDLVYAAEVLEHIYDTDFFLCEVRRVLRDKGALVVTVPNVACLPNRFRLALGLYPKYVAPARRHWSVGEHIRAFTKGMLAELLERNSFKVEKTARAINGKYQECSFSSRS
jgi:2-polyprenyl-3-methyl-5-hydroxy-6-metoxy-1,4-benzoquinol methylase